MTPARHLFLGLVLTASAGMVDVVGFFELGGFYTSFVSGNTTQIGAGLLAPTTRLLIPMTLVTLFFLGSFAGAYLAGTGERRGPKLVLSFVLATLAISFVLHFAGLPPGIALPILALGAGAQNSVFPQRGAARLGATFVTGTLFAAGQDLARAVRGQAPPFRWAQHLLVWMSLCGGAVAGALIYHALGLYALIVPAAIYAIFLLGFVLLTNPKIVSRL